MTGLMWVLHTDPGGNTNHRVAEPKKQTHSAAKRGKSISWKRVQACSSLISHGTQPASFLLASFLIFTGGKTSSLVTSWPFSRTSQPCSSFEPRVNGTPVLNIYQLCARCFPATKHLAKFKSLATTPPGKQLSITDLRVQQEEPERKEATCSGPHSKRPSEPRAKAAPLAPRSEPEPGPAFSPALTRQIFQ